MKQHEQLVGLTRVKKSKQSYAERLTKLLDFLCEMNSQPKSL